MLTERWFRCHRMLAQTSVRSFDQADVVWWDQMLSEKRPDAGCQRPVDSSKVLERENHDRTRPISANRTLASVWSHFKHRSLGCTDRSIRSLHRGT